MYVSTLNEVLHYRLCYFERPATKLLSFCIPTHCRICIVFQDIVLYSIYVLSFATRKRSVVYSLFVDAGVLNAIDWVINGTVLIRPRSSVENSKLILAFVLRLLLRHFVRCASALWTPSPLPPDARNNNHLNAYDSIQLLSLVNFFLRFRFVNSWEW